MRIKGTMVGLTLLGICCPLSVFIRWKGLQIALEIVSFFSARAVFDFLLIYTLELFQNVRQELCCVDGPTGKVVHWSSRPNVSGEGQKEWVALLLRVWGDNFVLQIVGRLIAGNKWKNTVRNKSLTTD
ncbi:hypothetical protein Salat_0740100 [Sesamum alatum]|uniref:Uncharacterized protein n=1 Tax=Sesamum alatum TaxID=300844 RepID=A0AAE1YTJ2_9LAMI|nr:hypothetical protein Salat_0740100 [Sesamum alatum]